MNLLQFVPVKLTIFLVSGIVLGYYGNLSPPIGFLWVCCGLSSLALLRTKDKQGYGALFGGWVFFTTMGLGVLSVSLHQNATYTAHFGELDLEKPHIWKLRVREQLKSTKYYHRYTARVESIDSLLSDGLILLKMPVKDPELKPDNRMLVWTQAKKIAAPKNPHQFNYRKYLEDQGICHQMSVKAERAIQLQDDFTLRGFMEVSRQKIVESLEKESFGEKELGIIKALLLGDRRTISADTYENYKDAGAVHILAVSGLHIGIILILLQFLLKPIEILPRGRQWKLLVIVLLLWSYAFLAGLSTSVIRAVTMFSFLAYASYLNRPGIAFNVLALSAFFILLFINPYLVFQVGFQLSYLAVISILWAYPKIMALWSPRNVVVMKLWQLFTVGMAAQPGVLPLALYYFNQFPGLFFISNITLVPFLGVVLVIGFFTIVLALLGILPDTLVMVYNTMISYMNQVTAWVAGWEAFLLKEIYFDEIHLILAYLILTAFIWSVEKPIFRKFVVLTSFILLWQCWNIVVMVKANRENSLVIFHEVGETLIAYHRGTVLEVLTDSASTNPRLLRDYKTGEGVRFVRFDTLKNSYRFDKEEFLVVRIPVQIKLPRSNPDIVLLSHSPRINLDRFLAHHNPRLIIADGSNYSSFAKRWQKTCDQYDIPFHNTAEDGALQIKLQ